MTHRILPFHHVCTDHCNHAASSLAAAVTGPAVEPAAGHRSPPPTPGLDRDGVLDLARNRRRLLIKGGTIISMDPAVGDFAEGDLLIEDGRIVHIAPTIEATATTIDAAGHIVIPGFCDPHIHAWQGALGRLIPNNVTTHEEDTGVATALAHPTRSYQHVLHTVFAPVYRPEDCYIGTLVTLLGALSGGITTVCDNAHNSRTPAHADACVEALLDSGVRGIHAYGRPRTGRWEAGFPEDAHRLRSRYFSSGDGLHSMRLYMLGRDPDEELERAIAVRRDLDLWISFDSGLHLKPVVQLYADGRFDGRETINHGSFFSSEQKKAVVGAGATVNVCPRIEAQFRYGDIPYQEWIDAGLKPAISNDDPATYAINMFSEMQCLYAFQRSRVLKDRLDGHTALPALATVRDMLEAATIRGAENCGLDHKVGSLTPGKRADIVLIDTDNVMLHPINNAVCTTVQGANVDHVKTVFVDGRLVKWQGKLVGTDFPRIRQAVDASRAHLVRAAGWPLDQIDFTD